MPERPLRVVLTCEHASRRVPARLAAWFAGADAVLNSHRGWDPGAAGLAQYLAERLGAPLFRGQWTRLLIELNRSPHHPALWSEYSRDLPAEDREALLREVYGPYREAVRQCIARLARPGRAVLHVGVHTFSPVWGGQPRRADVGILYDPRRERERDVAREWQTQLGAALPDLRVRRNYPYRGRDDGLVTWLRAIFGKDQYLGLELEVNQALPAGPGGPWRRLRQALGDTLATVRAGAGRGGL